MLRKDDGCATLACRCSRKRTNVHGSTGRKYAASPLPPTQAWRGYPAADVGLLDRHQLRDHGLGEPVDRDRSVSSRYYSYREFKRSIGLATSVESSPTTHHRLRPSGQRNDGSETDGIPRFRDAAMIDVRFVVRVHTHFRGSANGQTASEPIASVPISRVEKLAMLTDGKT